MSRLVVTLMLVSACGRSGSIVADGGTVEPDSGTFTKVVHGWDPSDCGPSPHASAEELSKTPRANTWRELLIIESTGQFVADDALFDRVTEDMARLGRIDAGGYLGFMPEFAPSMFLRFDDAGYAELLAGQYSAWDCINATYDGEAKVFGSGVAFVDFRRIVDVRALEADYRSLPHVVHAEASGYFTGSSCGTADLCMDVDAGTLTYLGFLFEEDCDRVWYRLTDHADGGVTLEVRGPAAPADDWMDQVPACASRLWGHPHRFPDGGLK